MISQKQKLLKKTIRPVQPRKRPLRKKEEGLEKKEAKTSFSNRLENLELELHGVRLPKFDIEDQINAGDIGLFYASLRHGLNTIDPTKSPDVKKKDGRWWIGYNIHHSDYIDPKIRATGKPYDISRI